MNSIDDDAKLVGISPDVWDNFKKTFKCEQMEFESIVGPIDEKEAEQRHRASMAKRWFGYYRKCTSQEKKFKLIDQYNSLAKPKERE
jgi:nitrate/TMAO reductase-like tetraheme cytochrome c subunit